MIAKAIVAALLSGPFAPAPDAVQWRPAEFSFEASREYARPCEEVALTARFEGPGNRSIQVRGFWDGGKTWKVRFAPPVPGAWSYGTVCSVDDAGLSGKKGTFTAGPATGPNPLFLHGGFLRVSESRRYLTYADGTPFFWLGDTWWFCPSDLVPLEGSTKPGCASMFRTLLDRRREQGFSIVQMAFLGSMKKSGGVTSFMSLRESGAPDVEYWRQVDRYMDAANEAGLVPVVGLAFHVGMDKNSLEEWKSLWRYVVARYGAHAVTWLICGEYNQDGGDREGRVAKTLALGAFIKEEDPYRRAMTVHPWWHGGDRRQAWDQPWYDFIMLQGGHAGHGNVPPTSLYAGAWKRADPKPVLEAECNYEGIYAGKPGREHTADDVRRTAYHAVQAGSFGYTYGAHGLWYPTQTPEDQTFSDWGAPTVWWEALDRPGAAQMLHLRAVYESVEWWKLEPRPGAVTLEGKLKDATRPLAKSDGDAAHVVWFPQGSGAKSPASLACGGGPYAAAWFDPRTGKREPLAAPLPVADGACTLPARPDEMDWILVMKEKSR